MDSLCESTGSSKPKRTTLTSSQLVGPFKVKLAFFLQDSDLPDVHRLKCLIEGQTEFRLTGKMSDSGEPVSISGGDCVFVPATSVILDLKGGHWITIRCRQKSVGLLLLEF